MSKINVSIGWHGVQKVHVDSVVSGHVGAHSWKGLPQGPVVVKRLSFGAAANYAANGGVKVLGDWSARTQPMDVALNGNAVWEGNQRTAVVGAFVMGRKGHLHIRAQLVRAQGHERFGFVRAHVSGVERVPPTLVKFNEAGLAEVDLVIRNLSLDRVETIQEEWVWDSALAANERETEPQSWHTHGSLGVRIYVTAGKPLNALPTESFFHVACANPGARDARAAEDNVWAHVAGQSGIPLTNARGERLTMWHSTMPGNVQNEYVCRGGLELAVHGDSSCLGWADLLRQAFWIHGVDAQVKLVSVDASLLSLEVPTFNVHTYDGRVQKVSEVGLVVKWFKWNEAGTITPAITCGPNDIVNPGSFRWKLNLPGNPVCMPWASPDVQWLKQPGHLSEGCKAYGIYCNHAVVKVEHGGKERWYDPSHALGGHADLLSYQKDLLGVGEENPGGIFAVVGCRLRKRANPITREDEVLCVGEVFYGVHRAPETLCLKTDDAGG